jgi:tripartite-type tricarboxylate transporter receptor subunit TctC
MRRRASGSGLYHRRALFIIGGAFLGSMSSRAEGKWPTRPVRYINPFSPGGPADTLSRIACQHLGEMTGQQFVVENKSGMGGNIGTDAIAKSSPDGYTIGLNATLSSLNLLGNLLQSSR